MNKNKKIQIVLFILILLIPSMVPELLSTSIRSNPIQELDLSSSSTSESEDFSAEAHGTTGLNIAFIDEYHGYGSGWYCDHIIYDGPFGDHTKVLIMRDAQLGLNTWSVHYLDNSYNTGTIEFSLWLNSGGSCTNPHYHYLKFRDSSDIIAFQLRFDLYSNKAYYYNSYIGEASWDLIATLTRAEWYKYSINFNKDTAKFDIEVLKETTNTVVNTITNAGYQNNVAIEEVFLATTEEHGSGNTRWDDFLFSSGSDEGTLQYETPDQWDDFNFIYGNEGSKGDLEQNDNDFATIDSSISYGGDYYYLGTIKPNADIYTDWNEGNFPNLQHWKKIDEYPSDINGDGRYIRESSDTAHDRWHFTTLTIPIGCIVSRLEVYIYGKREPGVYTFIRVTSNAFGGEYVEPSDTGYNWRSFNKYELSIDQSTLDSLYVDVRPWDYTYPYGWVDIETIYIKVYYQVSEYLIDCQVTWDITNPNSFPYKYLKYAYRTTQFVYSNLDIYNWDTESWLNLESKTTDKWITHCFSLTGPYISTTNQVRIRFRAQSYEKANYKMELDQLCIQCSGSGDSAKTLIGSNNRYFPNIEESKLGFTISTIDLLSEPIIYFSIKEDYDPHSRYFRLYVDGTKIFDTRYNIPTGGIYHDAAAAPQLGIPGGHIIEIEINSGYYGDVPHYILEYLKVGGVEFVESYLYSDGDHTDRFTPIQIYSFDETLDGAIVAISQCLYDADENLTRYTKNPFFSTEIAFLINPDRDYFEDVYEYWYFINSMKLQWKIIDKNGNFLSYIDLNYNDNVNVHPSYNGNEDYLEMEYLIFGFSVFFELLLSGDPVYEYILLILDVLPDLLGILDNSTKPDKTSVDQAEEFPPTIEGSWTTGIKSFNNVSEYGYIPDPELNKASMLINYNPYLTPGKGYYQVQMTWILDLDRHYRYLCIEHFITDGIVLNGTYYYNFEYA